MPRLGMGMGLNKSNLPPRLQALINKAQPKLLLMAAKADGTSPLTGAQSPWVDKANKVGKNLFDTVTATPEFRVNELSGVLVSSTLSIVSDFINSEQFINYVASGLDLSQYRICFYDINKIFISGSRTTNPVTTPANCKFIRFSFLLADKDVAQLELGTTATAYEPYAKNNAALYNFAGTATSG